MNRSASGDGAQSRAWQDGLCRFKATEAEYCPPPKKRRRPAVQEMQATQRGSAFNVLRYIVLIIYSSVVLFPIFWIISTSLKVQREWITAPATWIPAHPSLENFQIVLGMVTRTFSLGDEVESFSSMLPSILNSLIISTGATLLALLVGTLAAYSISRLRAPGQLILVSLLGVRFLPPVVLSLPLLVLFTAANLEGSRLSVILTYAAYTVPYAVWLMKTFIDEVPRELEEAAIIDGCSSLSALVKIIAPLTARGLAVTGFFIFILNWTEFFLALTLTDPSSRTAGFQIYNYATKEGNLYGPQSAGALLVLVVPIIMGLAIQKYLVQGFTFGLVKAPGGQRHRSKAPIASAPGREGEREPIREAVSERRSLVHKKPVLEGISRREGVFARLLKELSKPRRLAVLFLAPLVILLLALVICPLSFELYLSLADWQANLVGAWSEAKWAGLVNYQSILLDSRFLAAIGRTILIVVASLILEGVLGLGLALLFTDKFAGKRILTSIVLLPMMVIPLVVGFTFYMLFVPEGPINEVLSLVLRRSVSIAWLAEPNLAIIPVILAEVYQWTPLMFMVFVAGLVAIPQEVDKAALVLGASAWQRFRGLSVPLLKPPIIVAASLSGVETVKVFDIVYVMTRGGPGHGTETLATYFYDVGYRYSRFSHVAAGALLVFLFISLAAWQAAKAIRATEER